MEESIPYDIGPREASAVLDYDEQTAPRFYLRRLSDGKYCRGARFWFWCKQAKHAARHPMSYWDWWVSFNRHRLKGKPCEFVPVESAEG